MKQALAVLLLRCLAATWRHRVVGIPDEPCVIAFWHGEMLPIWYALRHRQATALVSASKDGSILAALLTAWGFTIVRGSSSRGGAEALQSVVAALEHSVVLMTPDGPRGPNRHAKAGAAVSAQRSGRPLVAATVRCPHHVRLSSWDRFMIPLPFARIIVRCSEPMHVQADSDGRLDDAIHALASAMDATEP